MAHRVPWLGPGFTMAELLVVLVVVALMGLLVAPKLDILKFRMDAAVRGYAAAMVSAQRLAVKRQHDVVVMFDTTGRHLRIHEDRDNDGTIDADERVREVWLDEQVVFGRGGAAARSAGAAAVTFAGAHEGLPAVRFIRSGSASEQGAVYLTSVRAQRDPEWAKDTRALEVNRATGRVEWFYFEPPEWKRGF